jgi:hypothetical protein
MKEVSVYDAVGMVLAHDLTQIIPGEFKGSKFKKGHVIAEGDIEVLLSMGKRHLFVVDKEETDIHEDEAAMRIATAAAGKGIRLVAPGEGKIEMVAECDGLLKINTSMLNQLIGQDEIMFASIHENQLVKKGQKVAGTRVIPLFVNENIVTGAEKVCRAGCLIEVLPLKKLKIGLVTTGSEVYTGKIKDAFGPVLKKKFGELGSEVVKQLFADDDETMIAGCIQQLIDEGVDMRGELRNARCECRRFSGAVALACTQFGELGASFLQRMQERLGQARLRATQLGRQAVRRRAGCREALASTQSLANHILRERSLGGA